MPDTLFVYKGGLQSVPKDVTRVKVDASVQAIPNIAFKGCKQLKQLEFAKNSQLRVIGSFAFMDCISLEIVKLPKTTKRIGCGSFANCIGIKVVVFQDGLEVIGLSSFKGCHGLMYVSIPGSVNLMEPRAFANCISLLEVAIEKGLTKIPDLAFAGCESLETIGIPPSVTILGQNAIPKGVKQAHSEWFSIAESADGHIEKIYHAAALRSKFKPSAPLVSPTPTQPSQDDSPTSTQTSQSGPQMALENSPISHAAATGKASGLKRKAVQTKPTSMWHFVQQHESPATPLPPKAKYEESVTRGVLEDKAVQTKVATADSAIMTAPISQEVTVSLEQWETLNTRLDALEESSKIAKKHHSTYVLAQAKQNMKRVQKEMHAHVDTVSRALEKKTANYKEQQDSFQTELDSLRTKYQSTLSELQQAKEERDDLKEQISAMTECLEVLKKGVQLLAATRDEQSEFPLIVEEEESASKRPRSLMEELSVSSVEDNDEPLVVVDDDERPKKRSRTELKQAFSDALVEIGNNISKKIVSGIQEWRW